MSQKAERSNAHIKEAFKTGDISNICDATWDASETHKITHIAEEAGLQRSSMYRAFRRDRSLNFSTVLNVLTAIGLQLR